MAYYSTSELEAMSGRKEVQIEANNFGTTGQYDELQSLAIQVRNLIMMEPGTMPNAMDMGVGARLYVMERALPEVLSDLRQKIELNCRKFLPNVDLIRQVSIEEYTDTATSMSGLLIWVSINNIGTSPLEANDSDAIAIALVADNNSQTVVSKIFV